MRRVARFGLLALALVALVWVVRNVRITGSTHVGGNRLVEDAGEDAYTPDEAGVHEAFDDAMHDIVPCMEHVHGKLFLTMHFKDDGGAVTRLTSLEAATSDGARASPEVEACLLHALESARFIAFRNHSNWTGTLPIGSDEKPRPRP